MQDSYEVECWCAALALGELTCGCCWFVIERVDDVRAIADGPCVGLSFDSHFGRGANTSALFGDVESLNNGRGGGADRADDRGSCQHASVVELDSFMRCGNRARIQHHGDARFLPPSPTEFAEPRCYFGQELVLGMDQAHNNIFLAEIPVKAGAAADQFIDFAGNFYAAEARSHDDEA